MDFFNDFKKNYSLKKTFFCKIRMSVPRRMPGMRGKPIGFRAETDQRIEESNKRKERKIRKIEDKNDFLIFREEFLKNEKRENEKKMEQLILEYEIQDELRINHLTIEQTNGSEIALEMSTVDLNISESNMSDSDIAPRDMLLLCGSEIQEYASLLAMFYSGNLTQAAFEKDIEQRNCYEEKCKQLIQ